jgi:FkbM family methyltransferase
MKFLKKPFRCLGFEIKRFRKAGNSTVPASVDRCIGDVTTFLEDVRQRGFHPQGIIDVGANRGGWTKMARRVFPGVPVILIEPQREMECHLRELCDSDGNLEYVLAGAGAEKGELVQTIWEDLVGSSFLPATNAQQLHEGTQRVTPVITIDGLLKDRPDFQPDLVKLDIQGFELEALKGASSLFGRTEVFILETSLFHYVPGIPLTADCIRFMSEKGYELYDLTEYSRRPLDGALGQVDLAFARRNGLLRSSMDWNTRGN